MYKYLKSITALALLSSITPLINAAEVQLPGQFSIKIPLELKDGGSLPDGSIIIGDGSGNNGGTNPTNPNDPTNPTDPVKPTNCSFDISDNFSVFATMQNGEDYMEMKYYNNQMVSNGVKGELKLQPEDNVNYYEICFNDELPIISGPPTMPEESREWDKVDDCRYNKDDSGYKYFFREVSRPTGEYADKHVFTNLSRGILGAFDYMNVYYEPLDTETAYGIYKNPDDLYNTYVFPAASTSKGYRKTTLKESNLLQNGDTEYYYEICQDSFF